MVKYIFYISFILLLFGCKKAKERGCFKSTGDYTEKIIPLDSVSQFFLYKNISYHIYQDTSRVLIIKGGENLVDHVEVTNDSTHLSITNKNRCHFLRDVEDQLTVEIHYPFFYRFYSEAEDSVIFHDTIRSNFFYYHQRYGGAKVEMNFDGKTLIMLASNGVGRYQLSGQATYADLRVQGGAAGDASQFVAEEFLIDQNSTGNLLLNLNAAIAKINLKGTGDVIYSGIPDSIILNKTGDGDLVEE